MEPDGEDWSCAKRSKSGDACVICKKEFTLWHQGEEIKDKFGSIFVHANCVVSVHKFHHMMQMAYHFVIILLCVEDDFVIVI